MAPFKCPVGLAAMLHACPPDAALVFRTTTVEPFAGDPTGGTFTVRCTCSTWRGVGPYDNTFRTCPIHDTNVTYTGWQ